MHHLSPEQQLDLVEGQPDPAALTHIAECEQCSRDVARLTATLSAVVDADVPEPSPLFWDHFSARVHEAVAAEPTVKPGPLSWLAARNRFTWKMASMAGFAIVLLAVVVSLNVTRTITPSGSVEDSSLAVIAQASSSADVDLAAAGPEVVPAVDDASLALLADLASDLDWDAAAEAGLAMPSGGVDRVVADMSDDERAALHRLLTAEMTGKVL